MNAGPPHSQAGEHGAGRNDAPGAAPASAAQRRYWQRNLRFTSVLLTIWFVVTFVVGYFARELNFDFFGWPFSFWVAAQGALVVYVLIVAAYARFMNRLDREHGVAEEQP
jgi:putative solute:sodium symporter small subunit